MNKFTIELDFNKANVWFYMIVLFTFLNAFFNFLSVSYAESYPYTTFLFTPQDLHADLIKVALSYLQNENIDYRQWSQLFQSYYTDNPYGSLDKLQSGELTHFHLPPLATIISLINARIIKHNDPNLLLALFYIITFSSISILAFFFGKDKKERPLLLIVVLFSYPMLFTLTRGHIYSIVTNFTTIFFLYNVFRKNSIIIPIMLMAIMFNMRPNAFFLGLLFFIYGFKKGLIGIIFSGLVAILLFGTFLNFANYLYSDYTFENFKKGIKIYYKLSVLGNQDINFNNSLLGIFKILKFNNIEVANKIIFISLSFIGILSIYLFIKRRITSFDFIFLISSLYVLISSIFATYYMTIFFIFLLLSLRFDIKSKFFMPIIIASVFLLVPKNYIFKLGASLEVLMNPLLLFSIIIFIICKSIVSAKNATKEIIKI